MPGAPSIVGVPTVSNTRDTQVSVQLPDEPLSHLRIVGRKTSAPTSPWAGGTYIDVSQPTGGSTVVRVHPMRCSEDFNNPGTSSDVIYFCAYVWDDKGRGPVASPAVQAIINMSDVAPPLPPHNLRVGWDENAGQFYLQYTIDPDVHHVDIYYVDGSLAAPAATGVPNAGSVLRDTGAHYWSYRPAAWRAGDHGRLDAAWTLVAVDAAGNRAAPVSINSGVPPNDLAKPITPTVPTSTLNQVGVASYINDGASIRQDKPGLAYSGSQPSYGGVQRSLVMLPSPGSSGRTVASATLWFEQLWTYNNGGATIQIGHYWGSGNPPAQLRADYNPTSISGGQHVPKGGWVSVSVPTWLAQDIVDGRARGVVFSGSGTGAYGYIRADSVHIDIVWA
jgi:hypothetical protein